MFKLFRKKFLKKSKTAETDLSNFKTRLQNPAFWGIVSVYNPQKIVSVYRWWRLKKGFKTISSSWSNKLLTVSRDATVTIYNDEMLDETKITYRENLKEIVNYISFGEHAANKHTSPRNLQDFKTLLALPTEASLYSYFYWIKFGNIKERDECLVAIADVALPDDIELDMYNMNDDEDNSYDCLVPIGIALLKPYVVRQIWNRRGDDESKRIIDFVRSQKNKSDTQILPMKELNRSLKETPSQILRRNLERFNVTASQYPKTHPIRRINFATGNKQRPSNKRHASEVEKTWEESRSSESMSPLGLEYLGSQTSMQDPNLFNRTVSSIGSIQSESKYSIQNKNLSNI